MDELKPALAANGAPRLYTIVGGEFRLLSAPDRAYGVELSYYKRLPPLAQNSGNWLLAAAPDVYLYGALVQLGILTEDDRLGAWSAAYQQAAADLHALPLQGQEHLLDRVAAHQA